MAVGDFIHRLHVPNADYVTCLIGRILKLKAFGVEIEMREQFALELANAGQLVSPEKIEEVKQLAGSAIGTSRSTGHLTVTKPDPDKLRNLVQLAKTNPRAAIWKSWLLLEQAVLRAAQVETPAPRPTEEEFTRMLAQLENQGVISSKLALAIRNLREASRKVFKLSEFVFSPSQDEAVDFVLVSAALRQGLGEKVN